MTKTTCEHSGIEFESKDRWISVDYAVPPDERPVIIYSCYKWNTKTNDGHNKEHEHTEIRCAQRIVFKNGSVKWRCFYGGGFIQTPKTATKVTHWMPLPDPPKDSHE